MKDVIKMAASATTILVPKGDDSQPCLQAFEDATGIQVPEFADRKLVVVAGGRTFVKVKGKDIPGFVAAGYGDIGLTGSDSCGDYMALDYGVQYQSFGEQMCRFALLAPAAEAAKIKQRLEANERMTVATSFPNLLSKCASDKDMKLVPSDMTVSGSVEIMPRLLGVPLVADIVSSGVTAKANGLVEVASLMDVYPALVTKGGMGLLQPVSDPIERIDETLRRRGLQVTDKSIESYSLGLLRDSNKAGKKAGEEFGEVMMAIYGDGSVQDCEGEIADLIYAQLVAALSRNKPVRLANIIGVLVERNRAGSEA